MYSRYHCARFKLLSATRGCKVAAVNLSSPQCAAEARSFRSSSPIHRGSTRREWHIYFNNIHSHHLFLAAGDMPVSLSSNLLAMDMDATTAAPADPRALTIAYMARHKIQDLVQVRGDCAELVLLCRGGVHVPRGITRHACAGSMGSLPRAQLDCTSPVARVACLCTLTINPLHMHRRCS